NSTFGRGFSSANAGPATRVRATDQRRQRMTVSPGGRGHFSLPDARRWIIRKTRKPAFSRRAVFTGPGALERVTFQTGESVFLERRRRGIHAPILHLGRLAGRLDPVAGAVRAGPA